MKNTFVAFLLLLFVVIPGIAQKVGKEDEEQSLKRKDVPKAILTAFEQAYPKAKIIGYSKESDEGKTVYEIESKDGTVSRDATYADDGTVVSIEESFPYAGLPDAVHSAVTKDYPKARVGICEKVTKGTTIQYEVHLKSGKKNVEIVFDSDGKLVTKENK